MTKKDYIKIASILNLARIKSNTIQHKAIIRFITDELIKTFQQDNISFNPVKFSKTIYNDD